MLYERLLLLTSDHFDKLLLNRNSLAGGLRQCKESSQPVLESCLTVESEVVKGWMYRLFRQINHQQQTAHDGVRCTPTTTNTPYNLELNSSKVPEYALFRC